MKDSTKYKLAFAAMFLLMACAIIWAFIERKNRKDNPEYVYMEKPDLNAPILKKYTDAKGATHTVIAAENNAITKKQLMEHGAKSLPSVDSSAKIMNIAAKQIDQRDQVIYRLRADSLKAVKIISDKNKVIIFYKDKYAQIAYHPPVNPVDTNDQGTFDLQYDSDLTIVKYWKRKTFLGLPIGSKKGFIDISSPDPRFTIKGAAEMCTGWYVWCWYNRPAGHRPMPA